MKKSYSLIFSILCILLSACSSTRQSHEELPLVGYCDLVANPSNYDGQVVRIRASHVSGFEWSFITDEKCSTKSVDGPAHTWIVIPEDASWCENASQAGTSLPPQHDRSESIERDVIVRGVFHNSSIGVSMGEYPFEMEFVCLEKAGEWRVVRNE